MEDFSTEIETQEELITPSFEVRDGELVYVSESTDNEESAASLDTPDVLDSSEPEATVNNESEEESEVIEDQDQSTEPEIDDTEFFNSFSEEVGLTITSEEEIAELLKDYAKIKQEPDILSDPEIKAFYEFKQNGGDTSLYHQLQSKDFDAMDTKQLLKEKYLLDNVKLAKDRPKLANLKFEQSYQDKYKILHEMEGLEGEELEDFKAENSIRIETLEQELDYEREQAKESLSEWKSKSTAPPEVEKEISSEEIERKVHAYNQEVLSKVDEFEGLKIPIGEGKGDFNIGFDEAEKAEIAEYVKNPMSFFKEFAGVDEQGLTDVNKLVHLVAMVKKFDSIGKPFSDYILEQRNLETIEAKTANASKAAADQSGKTFYNSERDALLNARVL